MVGYYWAALVAAASTLVPGMLLALPLAKRMKLGLGESVIFGAVAGFMAVPALGFIESLAGIPFSFQLAAFNPVVVAVAGGVLCIREKVLEQAKVPRGEPKRILRENWHWIALALIAFSAFYLMSLSSEPFIQEFDPYYYLRAAQFIAQDGSIPPTDNLSWAPAISSHRERPLTLYMQAGFFELSGLGAQFDKTGFYVASSVYPPIAGALTCLLAYLLVSSEWGRKWGVLAAALAAFTPELIYKFQAGGVEQQPFGLLALLFFAAAYANYVKSGGRAWALLASFALFGAVLGSKQDVLAAGLLAAFSFVEAARKIASGEKASRRYAEEAAIIALGGIAAFALMAPYRVSSFAAPALCLAALAFPAVAYALGAAVPRPKDRLEFAAACAVIALVVAVISPLGPYAFGYIAEQRFLGESPGLYTTVGEEVVQNIELPYHLGVLGLGAQNLLIGAAFLALLAAAAYRNSRTALIIMIAALPLVFFGLQRAKFEVHLALALALLLPALLGEIENYARGMAGKRREAAPAPALQFSFNIGEGMAEQVSGKGAEKAEEAKPSRALPLLVVGVGILLALAQLGWLFNDVGALHNPGYWQNTTLDCAKLYQDGKRTAFLMSCMKIDGKIVGSMDWMQGSFGDSNSVVWWDYGHWVNYLGQSRTEMRGDLEHPRVVAVAADAFTSNDTERLDTLMGEIGAGYLVFSYDIVQKWDSISYLACLSREATNASFSPDKKSACEKQLEFEYVGIPLGSAPRCAWNSTTIRAKSSYNRTYCISDPSLMQLGAAPEVFFENGTKIEVGLQYIPTQDANTALMLVLYDAYSWDYRPGKAYESNFYRGFYLRDLPGFEQVYPENGSRWDIVVLRRLTS